MYQMYKIIKVNNRNIKKKLSKCFYVTTKQI